jgi:hypothetical protein
MKSRAKAIAYWAATGMIVFAMFSGGVAELMHRPETINGMRELGYPVYFIMIIASEVARIRRPPGAGTSAG